MTTPAAVFIQLLALFFLILGTLKIGIPQEEQIMAIQIAIGILLMWVGGAFIRRNMKKKEKKQSD